MNSSANERTNMGMQFCQDHWETLKSKITDAGLDKFVAANGQIAVMKQVSTLRGDKPEESNYDPLMQAHNEVMFNTLSMIGPFEGCPICTLDEIHEANCIEEDCQVPDEGFVMFLDIATESAANTAKQIGLIDE